MVLELLLSSVVRQQISDWLSSHPTESIGIGVAGLAIVDTLTGGKIWSAMLKLYDFGMVYLQKIYDIILDFIRHLTGFMRWMTTTFEVDNPRKTFLLSILYFFIILAIILLFSAQGWSGGGITDMERKEFNLADFSGVGAIGGAEGGDLPPTTTTTLNPDNPPPDLNYTWLNICYTDEDCDRVYSDLGETGRLCCYPSNYANYTCQGQCLRYIGISRDACKHPNACYNANGMASERVLLDSTNCIDKYSRDTYCHGTGDLQSVCCDSDYGTSNNPCYGYCTRANYSVDCQDINACLGEFEGF